MATATQMELDLVVRAVLAHLEAEAIILFGSQARGDSHPGSDMDLLIVAGKDALGGSPGYEILGRIYRELSVLPMGVDLLLYTPQEVQARRNSLNHVIARALRERRLLHGHV